MVLIELQSLPILDLVFSQAKYSGLDWLKKFEIKRGNYYQSNDGSSSGKNGNCNNRRRRYDDKDYDNYYDKYDYYSWRDYNKDDDSADDANNNNSNTTDNTSVDYTEPETESIFGERCCSWFWVNYDSQWEAFFVFTLFQLYNFLMVAFSPVIYPAYAIYISIAFMDQETFWSDQNAATAIFGHIPNIYWYMFAKFFFIDYLL